MAADVQKLAEVIVRARDPGNTLQKLERQTDQLNASMNKLRASTGTMAKSTRANSYAISNMATQMGDLVVQVSNGTNFFRALSQQLPQMAFGIGGVGIAIAAASTAFLGFIPALLEAKDGAKAFNDANERVAQSVDDVRSSIEKFRRPLGDLRKDFGDLADAASNIFGTGLKADVLDLNRDMRTLVDTFNKGFDVNTAADAMEIIQRRTDEVNAQFAAGDITLRQWLDSLEIIKTWSGRILDDAGLTVKELHDVDAVVNGLSAELSKGEISGEFGKTAQRIRESLDDAGRLTPEIDSVLTRVIQLESRWLDVKDATNDAADAARDATGAYDAAATAVQRLAAAAQAAAGWSSSIRSAAQSLATDTVRMTAEINAMTEGMDRYAVSTAGRIAAEQKRLRDMQGTVDPIQYGVMVQEFEQWRDVLLQSEEAQRAHAAATDVMNESLRQTAGTAGGGGGAASDATEKLEAFRRELEGYRTDIERAAATSDDLRAKFKLFGDDLKPEHVRLYNRAIKELSTTVKEVSETFTGLADVLGGGLNTMFDSIIDQTLSVQDAFKDMLNNVLRDVAKFLVSQQITSLMNILTQAFGGTASGWLPPVYGQTAGFGPPPAPPPGGGPIIIPPAPAPTLSRIGRPAPMGASAAMASRSNVNVTVYNQASNADVQVEEVTHPSGETDIRMYVKNLVKSELGSGSLDRTLRANYGIRRRPVG